MPTAIITGGSRGLGRALTEVLLQHGWRVYVDARDEDRLRTALQTLPGAAAVAGDVTDPDHRRELVAAANDPIDLLVNNASELGPSPLPPTAELPLYALRSIYETNVVAPLGMIQEALAHLTPHATVINVSSDAGVEPYEGWGGYGSSKAALDHLTAILAAEHPAHRFYAVDPGDMRTEMHQLAFPGEDISDRPPPEDSVPGLLELIWHRPPSGRYRVADLVRAAA